VIPGARIATAIAAMVSAVTLVAATQWAQAAPARPTATMQGASAQAASARAVSAASGARKVTFVNKLTKTIWVAASPDPAHPLRPTGWGPAAA
jgi:hypothetical protein